MNPNLIAAIIGVVITSISGVVRAIFKMESSDIILSALIIFMWLFVYFTFASTRALKASNELFEKIKNDISKLNVCFKANYATPIIDMKTLMGLEEDLGAKKIWVVNHNLSNDCPNGQFWDIVQRNLVKGVEYLYFTNLEDPIVFTRVTCLNSMAKNTGGGKVHICRMPENLVALFSLFDFGLVVYDPWNKLEIRQGYLLLYPHGIAIRIDAHKLDELIGLLATANKEAGACLLTP